MTLTPALHTALLGVSVLTTVVLAGYAWRHRTEQGVGLFGALMATFTLYSAAHLFGLLTLHPEWRLIWENVQWSATALLPISWLLFAMEYTGYDEILDWKSFGALSVIPVLTILLTWTNPWHGLMWETDVSVIVVQGLAIVEQPFGPWFLVFTMAAYGMISVGTFLLLRLLWLSDRLYLSQSLLLLVGITTPVLANVMTVFGLTPIRNPPLDMTPYAFSITGLAFGYALFRQQLFDLVPATRQLGRDAAIRQLEDGVVIVDTARQIIYLNPAAAELLDCEPEDVLGEPVRSLVDESVLSFETNDALAELEYRDRVYEVRTSPIHNRREQCIGHTLIVQDITTRKRRERRLTRQRDELQRVNRLNSIIRGVHGALVSATTRAEIERAVCDQLADSELYRTVCMADLPTWDGSADHWTIAGSDEDPTSLPAVLQNDDVTLDDRSELPVSTEAAAESQDTWTIVPLLYGRTVYGALGVCSTREDTTDEVPTDHEREVLAELGELIGHAINAVENRRLLAAESVIELEFHSSDTNEAFLKAASQADCRLDVTGLVPDAGEGHLAYVRVEGGPTAPVTDSLATGSDGRARTIRESEADAGEGGAGLVEWTIPANTLVGILVEHGAHVLAATAFDGTARITVEVASNADVRSLVDRIQREFPDTWLSAKREHDRPIQQADSISRDAIENLTDRQEEALEAAYRAGYFAWPRESSAEEVADTLDIASPTLHAHLRKAEDALFAELFDHEGRP